MKTKNFSLLGWEEREGGKVRCKRGGGGSKGKFKKKKKLQLKWVDIGQLGIGQLVDGLVPWVTTQGTWEPD